MVVEDANRPPSNLEGIELQSRSIANSRKTSYTSRLSQDASSRRGSGDIKRDVLSARASSRRQKSRIDYSSSNRRARKIIGKGIAMSSRSMRPLKILKRPFQAIRDYWKRRRVLPPTKQGRAIPVSVEPKKLLDERTKKPYRSNTVSSAIYTVWDFLPRQLVYQFSKLANIYFLFVAILQMIPSWSTTGSYTTIIPLMIFVGISMGREGYDDWGRHRNDREENNRKCLVLEPGGGYKTVAWKEVKVGDILRVLQNEWIPADIVLLHSSGPKGVASVETLALDGETNLKTRETPIQIQQAFGPDELETAQAVVTTEDPNLDLYNFEGSFDVNGERIPLSGSNVIYRGSMLRNTASVLGVVVFSGQETKVQMNATRGSRIKAPKLQSLVNKIVIMMASYVLLLSGFSTLAARRIQGSHEYWYLRGLDVSTTQNIMGFIIMFNTLIPISLYVSMEICKVFQSFIMESDVDMYDEVNDVPCRVQTSSLNEELGQVSYVFSDKTGTLTDNIMLFRKLSVAGHPWLHDLDLYFNEEPEDGVYLFHKAKQPDNPLPDSSLLEQLASLPRRSFGGRLSNANRLSALAPSRTSNRPRPSRQSMGTPRPSGLGEWQSTANPEKPQTTPSTLTLIEHIMENPLSPFSRKAHFFLLAIALCHTAAPEVDLSQEVDGSRKIEQLDYQAASPDELALVAAARDMGYLVIDRQQDSITIRTYPAGFNEPPQDQKYEILDVIEFSSARKRMSIIVRLPNQQIVILCKGADNVIIERLRKSLLRAAKAKKNDIAEDSNLRRSIEADLAIETPRPSLQFRRGDPASATFFSLDEMIRNSTADRDIQESGRRSMQTWKSGKSVVTAPEHLREPFEAEMFDDRTVLERTLEQIDEFSTEGLRTLLYGHRFLTNDEYAAFKKEYDEARSSLTDRQKHIESVGEKLEREFEITGATAIEDKLQQGVPEAIEKLRRANIRMWMLTGDKRETAINIGYSCRLIKDYSTLIILRHEEDITAKILAAMEELEQEQLAHTVMVLDGACLARINDDAILLSMFIELGLRVDAVILCRASPSQKASIVKNVRQKKPNKVMLAIGDGANDIAMLQAADLGIGIAGREGLQAARSSDFAIGQFRFLLKLLFVHGRWNYIRTSKYILSTFYKEFMFYMCQVVYQRNTMFTGTSLFESWSISMFNTLFTSLPVICIGVMDQDLSPTTLIAIPELYRQGQENRGFSIMKFIYWIILAQLQCVMISFLAYNFYGSNYGAKDTAIYPLSVVVYLSVVLIVCTKFQFIIMMHYITAISVLAAGISVWGYLVWNLFVGAIYDLQPSKTYFAESEFKQILGKETSFWATVAICWVCGVLFELSVLILQKLILTTDADVFEQLEMEPVIYKRLEQEAESELHQGWKYQDELDHSWWAFFRLKWPGQPRARGQDPVTSRRRKRDIIAEKLWRKRTDYDREIQEILEQRERETDRETTTYTEDSQV